MGRCGYVLEMLSKIYKDLLNVLPNIVQQMTKEKLLSVNINYSLPCQLPQQLSLYFLAAILSYSTLPRIFLQTICTNILQTLKGKRIVFPVCLQEINQLLLDIEKVIQISAQSPMLKKIEQPSVKTIIFPKTFIVKKSDLRLC